MSSISEKIVAELPSPPSGNKLHYFSGAVLQGKKAPSGFAVRVTSAGTKSFVWFHRVEGRPHLETLGRWDENQKGGGLTVLRAIIAAKARADAVSKAGSDVDPRPERTRRIEDGDKAAGETVADVLDLFIKRYVEKEANLRSGEAVKKIIERLVKPEIGKTGIYNLRRKQIVAMLDKIADERGPVMADRTLAHVRKAFNWNAVRDDEFVSPIVKGMARTKPKERARTRTLTDEEIRDVWSTLEKIDGPPCYPKFVRFLLRTTARREEASAMRWDEIERDIWTIPGSRYKTKIDHTVPLTETVRDLIGQQPKDYATQPYVFATRDGSAPFSGYSKAKRLLDKKIAERRLADGRPPMTRWTLHDLRRTARSLMSRAGVDADHAERCLGHVITGVRGTYDRHAYDAEKKAAFAALDSLIDRILKPSANVTELRSAS